MSNYEQAIDLVAGSLRHLITRSGGVSALTTPRGYPHLGLAIVDAMFSLRANYDTITIPVLQRYCELRGTVRWNDRFSETFPEHGTKALLEVLEPLDSEARMTILNRQVAPGTKARKADVVVEIAERLNRLQIDTHHDLRDSVEATSDARRCIRSIKGVGPAAWRYILNLSRVERSKPDTMVMRWLAETTHEDLAPDTGAQVIEAATARLNDRGIPVSVRTVDHLVWQVASGRLVLPPSANS